MIYLVEITGLDSGGTPTVYRYGTQSYNTTPADTPANTYFDGRVVQPGLVKRDMFAANQTTGGTQIGFGVVELINTDGALDALIDCAFDGQPIKIWRGEADAAFSTFTALLSATMDQPTLTVGAVTFRLRDYLYALDVALQPHKYAGSNSLPNGAEGVATDIKGHPKPLLWGKVYNISPPQVNTALLMYQVSDGAVYSVTAYDKGVALTAGTAHATYAALEGATPTAGTVDTWLAGGLFRLGSTPTGQVTADVVQTSSAANHTAAQIIKAVALSAGLTNINAADATALDAAQSAELGIWIDAESKPLDVIEQIKLSVGAYVTIDATGYLRMGLLTVPSGSPVATLDDRSNYSVDLVASADTERGIPAWRVNLGYRRMHTTQQPNELAGAVTQARVSEVGVEYRQATASDAAIKTVWPLAPEINRNSLLVDASAAATEAARLLAIYKVRRQFYTVTADIEAAGTLDLNQCIALQYSRFGLSAGKLLRVLGVQPDYSKNRVTLTLWG